MAKPEHYEGKVYESNNWGPVKVLKFDHKDENYAKYYKVEFLDYNIFDIKRLQYIKNGEVKPSCKKLNRGKEFETNNYGKVKILNFEYKKNNHNYYKVKFLDTGTIDIFNFPNIISGSIKDYYYPKIYNVGYYGDKYVKRDSKIYNCWDKVLARCYNDKNTVYKYYGAKGVKVSSRWHCYTNFAKDIKELPGWDEEKFRSGELQLDKDKLQQDIPKSKMVYSKETCYWLTPKENNKYKEVIK